MRLGLARKSILLFKSRARNTDMFNLVLDLTKQGKECEHISIFTNK